MPNSEASKVEALATQIEALVLREDRTFAEAYELSGRPDPVLFAKAFESLIDARKIFVCGHCTRLGSGQPPIFRCDRCTSKIFWGLLEDKDL